MNFEQVDPFYFYVADLSFCISYIIIILLYYALYITDLFLFPLNLNAYFPYNIHFIIHSYTNTAFLYFSSRHEFLFISVSLQVDFLYIPNTTFINDPDIRGNKFN